MHKLARRAQYKQTKPPHGCKAYAHMHLKRSTERVLRAAWSSGYKREGTSDQYLERLGAGWASEEEMPGDDDEYVDSWDEEEEQENVNQGVEQAANAVAAGAAAVAAGVGGVQGGDGVGLEDEEEE